MCQLSPNAVHGALREGSRRLVHAGAESRQGESAISVGGGHSQSESEPRGQAGNTGHSSSRLSATDVSARTANRAGGASAAASSEGERSHDHPHDGQCQCGRQQGGEPEHSEFYSTGGDQSDNANRRPGGPGASTGPVKFALAATVLSTLLGAARSLDVRPEAAFHTALRYGRDTLSEVNGPADSYLAQAVRERGGRVSVEHDSDLTTNRGLEQVLRHWELTRPRHIWIYAGAGPRRYESGNRTRQTRSYRTNRHIIQLVQAAMTSWWTDSVTV